MNLLYFMTFGALILIWLGIFLFCYSYYSQVDRNRINFKMWSIISFLFMFALSLNMVYDIMGGFTWKKR